jgi:hypothetical protein
MDSIKYRNDFIEKSKIIHSPIIIKKIQYKNSNHLYIVLGCKKEQVKEFIDKKDISDDSIINNLINLNFISNKQDIKNVLFIGKLTSFKSYEKFVFKFKHRKIDIINNKEPQYRLYTRSLEYQKNIMWLTNLCNSAEKSWKSVCEKVGSEYGLLIKVEIPK